MKRKSTIYGIQSAGMREDKDARRVIKEHGGEG
jgi:methyl coenzyme M reductase gamma subunit